MDPPFAPVSMLKCVSCDVGRRSLWRNYFRKQTRSDVNIEKRGEGWELVCNACARDVRPLSTKDSFITLAKLVPSTALKTIIRIVLRLITPACVLQLQQRCFCRQVMLRTCIPIAQASPCVRGSCESVLALAFLSPGERDAEEVTT